MTQELHLLNEKLDLLIKKYSALKAAHSELKKQLEQQVRVIHDLNRKLSITEENAGGIPLNKMDISEEEKMNMKKQLDAVIGEIDKILLTLND